MDDYAVVIGISRYPGLNQSGGMSFDLLGPDRDADAIHDWLVSPSGGNLKPDNVMVVKTSLFPVPAAPYLAQPGAGKIREAFQWAESQAFDTNGARKGLAGRRLYVYTSGHGFLKETKRPALLTAEANLTNFFNTYVHGWIEQFRGLGYFQEYVVWADCCMNPFSTVQVEELPNKPAGGLDRGIAFTGVAASTRSALESEMSDGQVHGVFTWTLLQGLNGKAAEDGQITGESLVKFLYNAMADNLPKEVREASNVDVKPAVETDPGIVFRTGVPTPGQDVTLKLDAPDGTVIQIWGGEPHAVVKTATLAGKQSKVPLDRGLYVAEIAPLGFRHGFEVTGSGDVEVSIADKGPAVKPAVAGDRFTLNVQADNQAALITVIDHQFGRRLEGTGIVAAGEPAGLYKIRVQIGRDICGVMDRVIVLDRSDPLPVGTPALPAAGFASASAPARARSVSPFEVAMAPAVQTGLSIVARYWTNETLRKKPGVKFPNPFEGLEIVDANGARVAGLLESADVTHVGDPDPVLTATVTVVPGTYFLRQTLPDGRILETSLIVVDRWLTQCVIRRASGDVAIAPAVPHVGSLGEISMFMRGSIAAMPAADETIEAASIALADHRPVFEKGMGKPLHELLTLKYQNPIAGIVGGHLWILSNMEQSGVTSTISGLDEVVSNLRAIVGDAHPDVEALSLKCSEPLRTKQPIRTPPIFRRSWDLLIEASTARPDVVPKDLWDRVHAVSSERLHFVWAADERSRTAHKLQLRQAASVAARMAAPPPPPPPPPPAPPSSSPFESFRSIEPARAAAPARAPEDEQKAILECARTLNVVPSAIDAAYKAVSRAPTSSEENTGRFCSCLETKPTQGHSKAALLSAFQWATGSSITVAFLGGDPALQERIKKVAQEWTGPGMAHLAFNFVNGGDADVRIAFIAGSGSWSYLGTMCRQIDKTKPTMNFGWLTPASSDDELRRVVLHEFGHAIGLIHEHQNPLKPIQWNRDAVKKDLSGPPNNWDDQTIDANIYSHYTAAEVLATAVDPSSIMMYPIPKAWTTDGFSAGLNGELSETDRDLIRIAYPW